MQELIRNEFMISLTIPELISILKSVLIDRINVNLDELDINVISKYINNMLYMTFDTEQLREESEYKYIQFVQDVKRVFGPYIFTVNTQMETNILINNLFAGYDHYETYEDMTIKIYY